MRKGQPLAVIHAGRQDLAEAAEAMVRAAITLGDKAKPTPDLILDKVD